MARPVRFVVTSLQRSESGGAPLQDDLARARRYGTRIKECQLDLFADRTRPTMHANQLRLWFASMA